MLKPPIIFLAFANDLGNYLHKLSDEKDAIRDALEQMQDEEICEIIYETNTSLEKIWEVFDKHQERIAIFHYGGHAEDYALLLQNSLGEQQLVNGEGLVSFLARQKGLQLVFLNGCSSKRQAEELRDKGIPAVIGTSEPIDDSAAKILAETFYKSLANGRSIKQAWMGAKERLIADQVKNEQGYYRSVGRRSRKREAMQQFPWELYIRPGAELVEDWNLPKAASNPLFGLPLPDEAFRNMPLAPFVGLHYFTRKDAAIFHGRGAQIRELYNHLEGIHPIILVYGKSGVGKSSMLDAGFRPRIEDRYGITYIRRIQERGLLGTLDLALDQLLDTSTDTNTEDQEFPLQKIQDYLRSATRNMSDQRIRQLIESFIDQLEQNPPIESEDLTAVLKKWLVVEEQSGKPLVVILDQVEEKFTRPMPMLKGHQQDELEAFLLALQPLFSQESSGINGKIILSYRKEYHPEISDALQSLALPFSKLFLKRLDRAGIIEAISGSTSHDKKENGLILHNPKYNPYHLELEDGQDGYLPEIIAEDLMEDPESPIAPVLQIILEKLWETAPKVAGQRVKLTIDQYQELSKQGTTMHEFFQEQMAKIAEKHPQAFSSGLILDILLAHTTDVGTAGSCLREELLQQYAIERGEFTQILQSLESLTLLVRIDKGKEETEASEDLYTTLLAHDTLAPVVIREHNLSDAPGQRADRILGNKLADVGCQLPASYLEKLRITGIPDTVLQELAKPQVGWDKFQGFLRHKLGEEDYQKQANLLLDEVNFNLNPNGQAVYLEEIDLRIVEEGCGLDPGHSPGRRKLFKGEQLLLEESKRRRAQRIEAEQRMQVERQALQDKVTRRQRIFIAVVSIAFLLAAYSAFFANKQAHKARIAALPGLALEALEYDQTKALNFAMAYQAAQVDRLEDGLTPPLNRILKIPNQKFYTMKFLGQGSSVSTIAFSPNGEKFVTGSVDGKVILWSIEGEQVSELSGGGEEVAKLAFAPNGKSLIVERGELREDHSVRWETSIYDVGEENYDLKVVKGAMRYGAFSESSQYLYMVEVDGSENYRHVVRLDQETARVDTILEDILADTIMFSPSRNYILTITEKKIPSRSKNSENLQERLMQLLNSETTYQISVWDIFGKSILVDSSIISQDSFHFRPTSFSPDENYLVGLMTKRHPKKKEDFLVKIGHWGLENLEFQKFTKEFVLGSLSTKRLSLDGRFLFEIDNLDQSVRYMDTEIGRKVALDKEFSFLDFNSRDNSVIGRRYGQLVTFYLYPNGNRHSSYEVLIGQRFSSYAFSPDNLWIVSGNKSGDIYSWNISKQPSLPAFGEFRPTSLAFSPFDDKIITGHENGIVKLWGGNSSMPLDSFGAHDARVTSIAISPDGSCFLTGSEDSTVKLWNRSGGLKQELTEHGGMITGVEFSPNGSTFLTKEEDSQIKLWRTSNGKQFSKTIGDPRYYCFSPDGELFLFTTSNIMQVETVIIDLANETFKSTGYSSSVFVRNPSNDKEKENFLAEEQDSVRVGKMLLLANGSIGQELTFRDVFGDYTIGSINDNRGFSKIVASSDGRWLIARDDQWVIKAWNMQSVDLSGKKINTPLLLESPREVKRGKINSFFDNLLVSADNNYIVNAYWSYGQGYKIELWNLPKAQLLQTFNYSNVLKHLNLSPDNKFLYSNDGGQIQIWPTYLWELQEGRIWNKAYKFSKEEQKKYGITWDY